MRPRAGSPKPAASATLRRNLSGVWISMPAPSPVASSEPAAPRCVRRHRTVGRLLDDVVTRGPLEVGHEADAARVVFEGGIVEALLRAAVRIASFAYPAFLTSFRLSGTRRLGAQRDLRSSRVLRRARLIRAT